jgi:hypothetical protein
MTFILISGLASASTLNCKNAVDSTVLVNETAKVGEDSFAQILKEYKTENGTYGLLAVTSDNNIQLQFSGDIDDKYFGIEAIGAKTATINFVLKGLGRATITCSLE